MSLENKTLAELEQLAVKLRQQIASNPEHSKIERVELEDVKQWIALRHKETTPTRSDDPHF
jgi:hypothetical protein